MQQEEKQMKPIWFFVGLMLLTIGIIVVLAGIDHIISPRAQQTVLQELHPNLWWGGIMVVVGAVFLFITRKS